MASNIASVRGVEIKSSDAMSEVSETGTGTSGWTSSKWDSREDLRDFVSKLGLRDIADLYQDRFKVDRKKLEQMLSGDSDALIPADVFFAKIMDDTDTYITWPNKLKIGAKSKKDPHVRIAGRPEDVQAAKERIMTILNTRCNRVTMKMDVSYTDHSHIIGKGGMSIKRVMEETKCHVHFPDSNRSNQVEKSNQVSISGDIEGVECARSRVRELIPLIFGFELPIFSKHVDTNSTYITKVQDQYKVQVLFKTRPKLHATLVLVKGVEWEVDQVKRATLLLMNFLCDNLASQIPVQMSMEISPHHHQVVLGNSHSNLKAIMQYTNCQILFPEANDPNIPSLKKSNVNITGHINNVYRARQLLMGSLPLLIIFDLPEECSRLSIRTEQIREIQEACSVVINIRSKAKQQNTKACVIKGIERNASNMYKARNMILGLDDPPLVADIPTSYSMPPPAQPVCDPLATPTNMHPPNMSPVLSPFVSPSWQYSGGQQTTPFTVMQQPSQFLFGEALGSANKETNYANHLSLNSFLGEMSQRGAGTISSMSSNASSLSPAQSPRNSASPNCQRNFGDSSDKVSEMNSVMSEMSIGRSYHGISVDKRQETRERSCTTSFDYESKRLAGLKAMQTRPNPGTYRVPTSTWSGYNISHTGPPGFVEKPRIKKEEDIWTATTPMPGAMNVSPNLNTSNLLDHTPTQLVQRVVSSSWTDLPSTLTCLGLERYINIFNTHEIDLSTFATLNDQDLMEIGINAFGARRKMLLAISELNKRANLFSAAPGAERKSSSSTASPISHHGGSPRETW